MAKVIEFYVRDLFPRKVKSVPCDRRGEVIEFPKGKPTAAGLPNHAFFHFPLSKENRRQSVGPACPF
jgi:hypothetical protein